MELGNKKNKVAKKSPIKDKPLRHAGQSIQQYIQELRDLDVNFYIILAGFIVFFILFVWFQHLSSKPINPWYITAISLFAIAFCVYKILRTRKKMKSLKLGMYGEKEVAEELDKLRECGCLIFHDIVADNFNLDHVIISEKGIFVVETKTLSKPIRGDAKITYDGSIIKADGIIMRPNPTRQASANAGWLRNTLKESTGKDYRIKSIIVFPGWYVESKIPLDSRNILVLNPKMLISWLKNIPDSIKPEDKQLAAYHLSREIRRNG